MTTSAYEMTYRISGNTFPHKDYIRSLGGTWDKSTKTWTVVAAGKKMQSAIESEMRRAGLSVERIA